MSVRAKSKYPRGIYPFSGSRAKRPEMDEWCCIRAAERTLQMLARCTKSGFIPEELEGENLQDLGRDMYDIARALKRMKLEKLAE